MHHREDSHTDLGTIKIHKNVIASIASLATGEIEGVKRVGSSIGSGLLELVGKKGGPGIKVEIDKNEEVDIEIPVIIAYGFNIPEVAGRVQENVRQAVEKMTQLLIKDINIIVKGIEKE